MLKKCLSLADNPLCGISTYKDSLNLATGAVTRYVKKLVLTGTENFTKAASNPVFTITISGINSESGITTASSHYKSQTNVSGTGNVSNLSVAVRRGYSTLYIGDDSFATAADFKSYLAQQYANGTPVTVWYVLATPETETITVPQGLTGTIEGFLNQDGTPTPTNPIYPTAKTNVWYEIPCRKYSTETDTLTSLPAQIIADGTPMTEWEISGNMEQTSGTTTVPSKSVTVSSLESGTNYALFPKADFSNAVVGDTINIVVGGTSYSQKVMKIDTSYVYIENRTV